MKYNLLENNCFYFKKGNHRISYRFIYDLLLEMKKNRQKKTELFWNVHDKKKNDKIGDLQMISYKDKSFIFKIDNSPKLIIEGCNKIIFQDEERKTRKETYVYNVHQIKEFQSSLISSQLYKDISLFDESGKLIEDENDLFKRVKYLKKKKDNSLNKNTNEKFYQQLFNNYLKNEFKNERENLSINLYEYTGQNPKNFEYFGCEERKKMFDKLDDFIESKNNYLGLTGVSGTGKTVTLLEFLKQKSTNFPNCYFNITSLYKNSNIKKMASEFVKLFNNYSYSKYYFGLINLLEKEKHIQLWDKIIKILDYIIKIKPIKENIIIVFDQYKIDYDINNKLLKILQSEKYSSRIKFIICSSINKNVSKSNLFYSTKLKTLRMNNINYSFINNLFSVKSIIKNSKIKELMEKFNNLPKYYFLFVKEYHEDTIAVKKEEYLEKKINKFISDQFNTIKNELISFYNDNRINLIKHYNNICRILQGESINEFDFLNFILMIPLKYCKFTFVNANIKISPSFNFFYFSLRAVYKEMQNNALLSVADFTKNRGELGNAFDNLVNYHFDINKKIFGFQISHVIHVNEIINFSYFKFVINDDNDYFNNELNLEKLFDGKPIYLEQGNINGQCVDGGFLIPIPNTNFYSLLLYQSSIKKRKHFTKEFLYNYIYLTAKENLKKMFGINIQKFYFMYIIDFSDLNTIKYCKKTGIFYIFYSYDQRKFIFSNYKDIESFNERIFDSLEIQKPNSEIIEKIKKMETNNDISGIKNILLNKKRYRDQEKENIDNDAQKNNESDKVNENNGNIINIIKNIKWCRRKKGYTNDTIKFLKLNKKEYEKKEKEKYQSSEQKVFKEIPDKWKNIFTNFNYYCCVKKDLYVSNAKFKLPFFYIFDNKYIIIKDKKFSFYDIDLGDKIVDPLKLRNILDSLNPFCVEDDEQIFIDAYYLCKKKKKII